MTRFFFDLHECGHGAVIDEEGVELPDLAAAQSWATRAARDVMAEQVVLGRLCLGCAIAVRDEGGATVMAVPFIDAVAVTFQASCL